MRIYITAAGGGRRGGWRGARQHDVFFFGLQPRNALRSAVEAYQLDAPEVAAVASASVRGSADVVSAGFGSTSAASASRVDGFGAPSVVASATAGAWAAAEDAAAPASSANALSATPSGAMLSPPVPPCAPAELCHGIVG